MIVPYSDIISDPEFALLSARAQELAGNQALVEKYLASAERFCSSGAWLNTPDQVQGIKLLVFHKLTLMASTTGENALQPGFAMGQITSISASQGSRSVSFSDSSKGAEGDEMLFLTAFGQEFLRLRRSLVSVGFVIGS